MPILFYEVFDGLLAYLNDIEEIRDVFFHYPLGYQDLDVALSFDYHSKGYLKKDEIGSIHVLHNEILYKIVEEEGSVNPVKKEIVPDVYITQEIAPKYKYTRHALPEEDRCNTIEKK